MPDLARTGENGSSTGCDRSIERACDGCVGRGRPGERPEPAFLISGSLVWPLTPSSIPVSRIVSFAPGLESRAELAAKVTGLIDKMGDPQYSNREQAEKEPLIQRAVKILDAQILKVDEGFGMAPTLNADEADNEE